MVECWWWVQVSQPEERSFSIVYWYSSGYLCIFCQTAAGSTHCGWGGCCLVVSFGLWPDLNWLVTLMIGNWVPVVLWVVLITCIRAFLSWALHKPHQFVMIPIRILPIAPLEKLTWYGCLWCLQMFVYDVYDDVWLYLLKLSLWFDIRIIYKSAV